MHSGDKSRNSRRDPRRHPRRTWLKMAALGLGALGVGGTLLWLWQLDGDGRQQMVERMGLSSVGDEIVEQSAEPARALARRWQRLLARGQLSGLPATVWQRFWYERESDSRPYMRASFCVLALERVSSTAGAPELVIEPRDLARVMPRFGSRWPALRTEIAIEARWHMTGPDPAAGVLLLSDHVTIDLNERLAAFANSFACDDPLRYIADWGPAVLGWFELEPVRATYTTFGEPNVICAERMLCALSVLTRLARL